MSILKKYQRAPEEQKTPLLREAAEILVDAREHFERPDGTPDWSGRSYAYRAFVRDVYGDAHVAKDDQASLQAAVRYHVGTVLRERLDAETLEDYGLIQRSPKERSHDRRENRAALITALTAKDLSGGVLLALSTCYTLLSKFEPGSVDELGEREAGVARATLEDLDQRVNAMLDRLAD